MTRYLQVNSFNFLTRIFYTFLLGDLIGLDIFFTFYAVLIVNIVQGYLLHKKITFNSKNKVFIKYTLITGLLGIVESLFIESLYQNLNYQFLATLITSLIVFIFRFLFLRNIFK